MRVAVIAIRSPCAGRCAHFGVVGVIGVQCSCVPHACYPCLLVSEHTTSMRRNRPEPHRRQPRNSRRHVRPAPVISAYSLATSRVAAALAWCTRARLMNCPPVALPSVEILIGTCSIRDVDISVLQIFEFCQKRYRIVHTRAGESDESTERTV
jgi:hypothetical protein